MNSRACCDSPENEVARPQHTQMLAQRHTLAFSLFVKLSELSNVFFFYMAHSTATNVFSASVFCSVYGNEHNRRQSAILIIENLLY